MATGQRRLWLNEGESVLDQTISAAAAANNVADTYETIFERFSSRPEPVPFTELMCRSLVVGEEFILTCLFLAAHRAVSTLGAETIIVVTERFQPSLVLIWLAFFLVILHNKPTDSSSLDVSLLRKQKVRHRTMDGLFMAVLLRYLAAVLKTLTASYSSDTVHALAIAGFGLHMLACDYSYANGTPSAVDDEEDDEHRRPSRLDMTTRTAFQGGALSLTAAFFATTLLASRLEHNITVYLFVSSSVIFFALYPAARHQVARNTRLWSSSSRGSFYAPIVVPMAITSLLAAAMVRLLLDSMEVLLVATALLTLCGLVPLWEFILQAYKVTLRGPWDIAHVG